MAEATTNRVPFGRARAGVACVVLTAFLLLSCGGGNGAQAPAPGPLPSLKYSSPPPYVLGSTIAPLTPSITGGALSGFACPYLPAGLVIDPNTGVISGIPSAVRATLSYTIVAYASNEQPPNNVVTSNITITVNAVGPGAVSYGTAALTFTAGVPARSLTPVAGSPVTSWSITPQLPAGLSFNASDGTISGTPTAASPRTDYTVTAQGSTGTLSVSVAIEVDTDVLVDLGHNTYIQALQYNGTSVLSEDASGHWVLWDYSTGAMIASGDAGTVYQNAPSAVTALAGTTAVIRTPTELQVRSASTGALTADLATTPSWWSLATDGSYIAAGDSVGVSVWSPAGQLLVSRPGNYSSAIAFAAPGALRIGLGPAGNNVVETISVPGGTDAVSPQFNGQFAAWYLDGSGFLALGPGSATSTVSLLLYSNNLVPEGTIANPVVNGYGATLEGTYVQGAWLWTLSQDDVLTVSALAAPATPVATYSFGGALVSASATTIGVWDSTSGLLSVIDLSGKTPVRTDYVIPFGVADGLSTYAAASASQWVAGYVSGVLLDGASLSGTRRFFNYGRAMSVAANATRIAIATAAGQILYFNAATLAQEGTIAFPYDASAVAQLGYPDQADPKVALSSDGSVLAFLPPGGTSVNVYSLPSGSLLYSWPYPLAAQWFVQDIALSGSGTVLGTTTSYGYARYLGNFMQTASASSGGAPIFTSQVVGADGAPPPVRLSADGTQIATSAWGNPQFGGSQSMHTSIVKSGQSVPFVAGWPVGWIDNSHLLVTTYAGNYTGCRIYDLSGAATGSCVLPEVVGFQTLDSDTFYLINNPELVSVSTGAVGWQSGDPLPCTPSGTVLYPWCFADALAGSHVVLVSDSRVIAQSY